MPVDEIGISFSAFPLLLPRPFAYAPTGIDFEYVGPRARTSPVTLVFPLLRAGRQRVFWKIVRRKIARGGGEAGEGRRMNDETGNY